MDRTDVLLVALGLYAVMGAVTFLALAWDKLSAKRDKRRTPEQTLHVLEICGGWLGSLIGQQVLKHKRRKASYFRVTWAIAVLHVVVLGVVLILL